MYAQVRARGAEILALAYQDVPRALTMVQLTQAQYPILADANHAVADAYGVFNLLGDGVATPSASTITVVGMPRTW